MFRVLIKDSHTLSQDYATHKTQQKSQKGRWGARGRVFDNKFGAKEISEHFTVSTDIPVVTGKPSTGCCILHKPK